MKLPLIHFDCKYFLGSRPCQPNKDYGIFCGNCQYYERDINIKKEFPVIESAPQAAGRNESVRKVIIIKLDASGDVLRSTSILPSLISKYPASSVTWITKTMSYTLLKNNELIDEIYFADEDLSALYKETFDVAINLDTGIESNGIMNRINAGVKFGYRLANDRPYPMNELAGEWYLMAVDDNTKRANKKTYHQIIHDICGLEYVNSKPVLKISSEIQKISDEIIKRYKPGKRELVLINLGGGSRWENKKWTKEGYASLIDELSSESSRCIGVIAGEEDFLFYSRVIDLIVRKDNVILFGCSNSLDEFIGIINASDKILTSDSLAMHIATALDKYTVVLVGPTSYAELDVFGNGKILHSREMECRCFYESKCRFDEKNCMTTLRPSMVIEALK